LTAATNTSSCDGPSRRLPSGRTAPGPGGTFLVKHEFGAPYGLPGGIMEVVFIAFVGTVVIMALEIRDFLRRERVAVSAISKTGSNSLDSTALDYSSTIGLYDQAA
jgi:hypothetical protein